MVQYFLTFVCIEDDSFITSQESRGVNDKYFMLDN